jgi:hypothetical protein
MKKTRQEKICKDNLVFENKSSEDSFAPHAKLHPYPLQGQKNNEKVNLFQETAILKSFCEIEGSFEKF